MNILIDGLLPRETVTPRDAEDVAGVLRNASEKGDIVTPVGGGSMLDLGVPMHHVDVAVDLTKLNRVLDYQPANLTVRTEAGISLAELNQILGAQGQCVPLDPPCPNRATVGGILATNASGPMRIRYGSARDLLIGIRVALPDGQIVKGGGQVVKNVAGYDLPKLFIGSLGTLGVIVEATFKLSPLPQKTSTFAAGFANLAAACATAQRVLNSPLQPLGLLVLNRTASRQYELSDHVTLVVRFGGNAGAMMRQLNDVTQWARADGNMLSTSVEEDHALWSRLADFATEHETVMKVGVLPIQLARVGNLADEIAAREGLSCALLENANGILLVALKGELDQVKNFALALRQVISTLGGHTVVQHAPRALREQMDVWGTMPNATLMKKLKQEFDPKGILNAGRLV